MNIQFLNDLTSHRRTGATFDSIGQEITPRKDVVTLVSKRVSGELNAQEISELAEHFLQRYLCSTRVNLYFGFFRLDNGDISIDVNCLVDLCHRVNTLDFARANGQESIWDGLNQWVIPTGGDGVSRIPATLEEVEHAAILLERGFKHPIQITQPA